VQVLSVVGARPQFVKLAPVDRALRAARHQHVIVHTGQHYDGLLSQVFFDDLGIGQPDFNLEVGSCTAARQVAGILAGLDPVLTSQPPDWVLVYGDTNSTLGGALAAAQHRLPLAHLEAGLRSFDRRMPEERNRVLADHAADLLLAPTPVAMQNLAAEGLRHRTVLTGDVMVDTLTEIRARIDADPARYRPALAGDGPYLLATVHRAETTDDPDRLVATLDALGSCPLPVRLAAHPRLIERARGFGLPLTAGALRAYEPLPYPQMIAAMLASSGVVTDSGGLQKEALLLGVPCTTLRGRTEWPETLHDGWNVLVPDLRDLPAAVSRPRPRSHPPSPYGPGGAAGRVVAELAARAELAATAARPLDEDLDPQSLRAAAGPGRRDTALRVRPGARRARPRRHDLREQLQPLQPDRRATGAGGTAAGPGHRRRPVRLDPHRPVPGQ
jgi:UDP-N-acetylglucosamine 2-epimerase (non-hydrolysing)